MIALRLTPTDSLDAYVATLAASKRWSLFTGPRGGILGAHLVDERVVSADLIVYTLRISNGACLPSDTAKSSTFSGKVYFRDLTVEADLSWTIEADVPRGGKPSGNRWPLVVPGAHVFLAGKQVIRRFAVYRGKMTAQDARTALDYVSPRLAAAGRSDWGPSRIKLPEINVARQESEYAAKLKRLRTALATGKADIGLDLRTDALGLQQSPGSELAYDYGGAGIYFAPLEQSPSALLYARTMADLWQERMTIACYHSVTGARITSDDWADEAEGMLYQPFETKLDGDEEAFDPYAPNKHPHFPPAIDPDKPWNSGSCAYEATQREIDTVDHAHLTRATLHAKNAAWCLNDTASHEYLIDLAQFVRQSWCEIGGQTDEWARNLRVRLMRAKANPGQGSYGRAFGWICDTIATGIALGDTSLIPCGRALLELHRLAALPTGISQRATYGGGDAPTMWTGYGMPVDMDCARTFEHGILAHGVLALMRALGLLPAEIPTWIGRIAAVFVRTPKNLAILERAAAALYDNPFLPLGTYDTKQKGPPNSVAVGKKGGAAFEQITKGSAKSDPAHVEPVLVELYRATGKKRYLDLLCAHGYPAATLKAKRAWYQRAVDGDVAGLQDREWNVEALAICQQVAA